MDEEYEAIRNNIRELRVYRGYTQAEVAEAVGLSSGHYCRIENGERKISMDSYIKTLRFLGAQDEDYVLFLMAEREEDDVKRYTQITADCEPGETKVLLDIMEKVKITLRDNGMFSRH